MQTDLVRVSLDAQALVDAQHLEEVREITANIPVDKTNGRDG